MADVANVVGGGTPRSKDSANFVPAGTGIPWLTPADLAAFRQMYIDRGRRDLSEKGLRQSSARLMPRGTVLMSSRAPIGYLAVSRGQISTNQGFKSFVPRDGVKAEFVFYWLRFIAPLLQQLGRGSTFAEISGSRAKEIPLLLAPTNEQERITGHLNELTAKLDSCRDRLERIPEILLRFRQAVLAAACSGRLTEDWRRTHPDPDGSAHLLQESRKRREATVGRREHVPPDTDMEMTFPDSWALASLDQLTTRITSGSRDWKQYYRHDGLGTFIMAQNVRPLFYDGSTRVAVSPPRHDRDAERSRVQCDDLLVTIVGANTGDVCRVPDDLNQHYVCQSVALIRLAMSKMSPFIELSLNSPIHGRAQYEAWIYGEGRPHLSFDHLRATAVPLPPLPEQVEIVRRVRALFGLADAIKRRLKSNVTRHMLIGEAILARAFRGELVPTEAQLAATEGRSYETAEELLTRISTAFQDSASRSSARGHQRATTPRTRKRTGSAHD